MADEELKNEVLPSHFTNYPVNSVLQKNEAETIAQNIMKILRRTGDTWRPLTWDEYLDNRQGDAPLALPIEVHANWISNLQNEKPWFEKVIGYCKSPDTAKLFSPAWTGPVQSSGAWTGHIK